MKTSPFITYDNCFEENKKKIGERKREKKDFKINYISNKSYIK